MLHRSVASLPTTKFDFVVVGAGAGGCATAGILALAGAKVALLEAGPPMEGWPFQAPLMAFATVPGDLPILRKYNWNCETERQLELNGRKAIFPRGRGLGGSTSINALLYIRGHRLDYEDWGKMHAGWSFNDVLPFFRDIECNSRGESPFHGTSGAQFVSDQPKALVNTELNAAFSASCFAHGLDYNPDFNHPKTSEGFGVYQTMTHEGQRMSAYRSFIEPLVAKGLPNLHVVTHCHANKLTYENRNVRDAKVTGVVTHRVSDGGGIDQRSPPTELTGEKGVILGLGAYHTPALLQRSGIGDEELLQQHGIDPVAVNEHVGMNLMDHLNVKVTHQMGVYHRSRSPSLKNLRYLYDQFMEHRAGGTGICSSVLECGGFTRSSLATDRPDIQFHFCTSPVVNHARTRTFYDGYTLHACHLYPKSRGWVKIKSRDPFDNPAIKTNFMKDPFDKQAMDEALQWALKLSSPESDVKVPDPDTEGGERQPWSTFSAKRVAPAGPVQEPEDRLKYLKEQACTIYHPMGTCAMGTVVDDKLKVKGVQNLSVADASVFPVCIGGNTTAPTEMVGARCGTFLVEESKLVGPSA